ncbi:mitochondrial transcription rescue factor 1 [Erpetoichthys calabaricus]|uniref:mitochondrial transcription rescue factor 1 n=1 Tax=Erpetoichthys calabaricus TaxID=27687 RepID=UPI002234CDC0|nr:mitochondrial transcription rescue factor 1 [Erpetoichthys calabaricus]XP_028653465.2 mitochondrial transcription rescue factor 1 [Erpetoichthys calabaricus]
MYTLPIYFHTVRKLTQLAFRCPRSTTRSRCWAAWCQKLTQDEHHSNRRCLLSVQRHLNNNREWVWLGLTDMSVRFKSSKSSKKDRKIREEEEEEEDDDPEKSDYEDEPQSDPNLPKDFKDLEKSVQSFRYDFVMKAGLDIARNKVEDAFYASKLRLNGQKLIKKSKTVKIGDTLDLVLAEDKDEDTATVMRVVVKKILGETAESEKYKVVLRRWKNLKVTKEEISK